MARSSNKTLKYLIVACVVFFLVSISYEYFQYGSVFNNAEHYRKVYREAIDLKQNEKYGEAMRILTEISPRYEAYDAVLYQQADCAIKTGDELTAQTSLKSLISKYPQSILYVQAKYDLGKSYLRAKMEVEAKPVFEDVIKNHPETAFELGSYYYLSQIEKKTKPEESLKYKKKYIQESFDGRFSQDCVESILSSKTPLTAEDNYNIGRVFFASQKYSKAVEYLNRADLKRSWFYLAKAYLKDGNKTSAKFILSEGITKYTYDIDPEDLLSGMQLYVNLSPSSSKAWDELLVMTKDKQNAEDIALFNKADYVAKPEAMALYKKIVEVYPKGDYASEALWNLFWNAYKNGNYMEAAKLSQQHIENYPDSKAASKMLFWRGKIAEKYQDNETAQKIYEKIINKFPDDYYAFRSYGRLEFLKGNKDPGWQTDKSNYIEEKNFKLKLPYTYLDIKNKYGATLAELLAINDFETIDLLEGFDEPFIKSWIYYKKGLKTKAVIEARDAMASVSSKPDYKDEKWKFVYPVYYVEEIDKYSKINKLDPYITISLIKEESHFNAMAMSASNAVGLMQLLPSTARHISSIKNYGYINEFLLFNAETNIKFGTAYLKYVQGRFDGKTMFAVCAYNGGPGSVNRWLKNLSYNDYDEFIENISYDETQNYVKKVYKSYWNYLNIYEQ